MTEPELARRPSRRIAPEGVLRWGYFLVLNAIALVISVAIFAGVLYADALDPYLRRHVRVAPRHPGATSAMAFSPLACSLLVGWGYAQRARRRKAAAAAAGRKDGGVGSAACVAALELCDLRGHLRHRCGLGTVHADERTRAVVATVGTDGDHRR